MTDGNEASQIILSLISESLGATALARDFIADALVDCIKLDPDVGNLVGHLVSLAGERHQAATTLVQYGYLWDAEIVMRAAFEAVVKVMFVCLADAPERAVRVEEFWSAQGETNDLRQSRHALQELHCDTPSGPVSVFERLVIPEEEEEERRRVWPKARRKLVAQKWSFTEMTEWIDKRSGSEMFSMRRLQHSYAIASNFVHADERAIRLLYDRRTRTADVRPLLEDAHAARVMSDIVANYMMMAFGVVRLLNRHSEGWAALMSRADEFFVFVSSIQERFWATMSNDEQP